MNRVDASKLDVGQNVLVVLAGEKTPGVVLGTPSFDEEDGWMHVVEIKPGRAITLPLRLLEPVTPFVAGLVGLMSTDAGRATMVEAFTPRPRECKGCGNLSAFDYCDPCRFAP